MPPPALILASASPRRVELLGQLTKDFQVVPSADPELHHDQFTATELARCNSFRKALAAAMRFPKSIVLGADTLVSLDGLLFGKPLDLDDARRMLLQLQGRTHQVVTGVCLLHQACHRRTVFADCTDVRFKTLGPAEVDRYLASINPLDKAGGYAIQEKGESLVAEIRGSFSNVVGLPLERLRQELLAWGIPPTAAPFVRPNGASPDQRSA